MNDENGRNEKLNVDYYNELFKLINFVQDNQDAGRFVEDLLDQMALFQERVKSARSKLKKNEPLLDDLLELNLHELVLRDSRVSQHFEISINDARRAMEALCNEMSDFFILREDNKHGWVMMIKKEAAKYGIK